MKDIYKKVISNINQDWTVKTLQEIVRTPAYADFTKPTSEWERRRAEYLQGKMKEVGIEPIVCGEVHYGRPTLAGFMRGKEKGNPKLMFAAHIDTHCPLDPDLQPHPFEGNIVNGEVKGVGTCDQLGTVLAAILSAMDAIRKSEVQLKRDFMVMFPSDEMIGARGIEVGIRWDMAGFTRQEQLFLAALVRHQRRAIPRGFTDKLPTRMHGSLRSTFLCLRFAGILCRSRDDAALPDFRLDGGENAFSADLPADWIESHPLTVFDLQQEVRDLKATGLQFRLNAVSS